MLQSIRNFSSSIYAKILLVILIVPFVLWGMGDVFRGGNTNTIASIDNHKISNKEFMNYINLNRIDFSKIKKKERAQLLNEVLSNYLSQKLILIESEKMGIHISEKSLANLIKNQKPFIENEKFSRTKYEKFLLSNNITSLFYEKTFEEQEIKSLLLKNLGGGFHSPKFLVNEVYKKQNQIREIESINLNKYYDLKFKFSQKDIENHYNKNDNYKIIIKRIIYEELTPKKLTGEENFNDIFFNKIDAIDEKINNGESIEKINKEFNLNTLSVNLHYNKKGNLINQTNLFPEILVSKLFKEGNRDNVIFLHETSKGYLLVAVKKNEEMLPKIISEKIKKEIKNTLKEEYSKNENKNFREKIKNKSFSMEDFKKLSIKNKIPIEKIIINNNKDTKFLNIELIPKIYLMKENSLDVISNIKNNRLVFLKNIVDKKINETDPKYLEYLKQSEIIISNNIFNAYDNYLNKKYDIDINQKSLERIKNYYEEL